MTVIQNGAADTTKYHGSPSVYLQTVEESWYGFNPLLSNT